jgi:hypothetical protein
MMYWYDAAIRLEKLYYIQKEKLDYYYKITGVQASSIQDLQTVYENKLAIDRQLRTDNENEMLKLKKEVKTLRIKNTVLTIGLGSLAATTLYFAIF